MGTYYIPRNVKGENRILMIFSIKGLLYTIAGAGIGLIFLLLFKAIHLLIVGLVITILFAITGFVIGTFKVPNLQKFEACRKNAGENIDDVIKRAILFHRKKNRIYLYTNDIKENDKND